MSVLANVPDVLCATKECKGKEGNDEASTIDKSRAHRVHPEGKERVEDLQAQESI
jgi:hypothetical protein